MRILAVVILVFTLAAGVYMNSMQGNKEASSSAPIMEDTIESSQAAPSRSDIPL